MLPNFKIIFPWVLVVILLGIILWPKEQPKKSIIESRLNVEESLVDSFSLVRDTLIHERDSSLVRIDTMGVSGLLIILHKNMDWYENKTPIPGTIALDSTRIFSEHKF